MRGATYVPPRGICIHASCKHRGLACAHRMRCIRAGIQMRTLLLLPTILLALSTSECLAQSRDSVTGTAQASPAAAAEPRSAFGRVMGVLIAKLVQDSTQSAQPSSDGGGTTLPIDVEVGAAFQPAASTAAIERLPGPAVATPAADAPVRTDPRARAPELALQAAPATAGR